MCSKYIIDCNIMEGIKRVCMKLGMRNLNGDRLMIGGKNQVN